MFILIIEDEKDLASYYGSIIEDLGYQPLIANNAFEACSLLDKHFLNIKLVITDIFLEEHDFSPFAFIISKIGGRLPILKISGSSKSNIDDNFLGKPFSKESLQQKIQGILHV
jgi:DNA-binding NtrC family response regulator